MNKTRFYPPVLRGLSCAFLASVLLAPLGPCVTAAAATEAATGLILPSANFLGVVGLNTIPTARIDQAGTTRLTVGAIDPYLHMQLGFQVNGRLYLGLRQTAETSSLSGDPDHLYPGLDLKLKLWDEKSWRPQMAIGLQSALGHKRMAAEYLVLSKRYENWDFTGGLGWGRLGTRQTIPNPLLIESLRDGDRDFDGEKPNSPADWFRGDVGVFGGVEYNFLNDFSIKADFTSDAYVAEKNSDAGFSSRSPFAVSLNYTPDKYFEAGIGAMGTDTILARMSLKTNISAWPLSPAGQNQLARVSLYRSPATDGQSLQVESERYGLRFRQLQHNPGQTHARLHLEPFQSTPAQLSQGWRVMANKSRASAESLSLTPNYLGLTGHAVMINRRDLEQQAARHKGSAEEIWRNLSFADDAKGLSSDVNIDRWYLTLKEEFSPSEEDNGILHRTGLIVTNTQQFFTHFLGEAAFRLTLFSNLDKLHELRPYSNDPIRSDIDNYTARPLSVERLFFKGFKTFDRDLHAAVSIGYLEELFAGLQTEILYRPWGKNWAIGGEAAHVIKRDYMVPFSLGFIDPARNTFLAHAYYEIPNTDFTFSLDAGRYLAGDLGGGATLKNKFQNGATLEAFITATNQTDPDIYDDDTNIYSGLRFTLPLGSLKYIPDGSGIEVTAAPFGRDAGQKLDTPHNLYEATEPLSYRHMAQNWMDVTD